jgi:hypothetical protein
MPTWRLIHPSTTYRHVIRGSLAHDLTVEHHIAGSGSTLTAYPDGAATPEDPEFFWAGGHVNTTTDEAVKDLWVANGFTAVEDVSGFPSTATYPGSTVYPRAS